MREPWAGEAPGLSSAPQLARGQEDPAAPLCAWGQGSEDAGLRGPLTEKWPMTETKGQGSGEVRALVLGSP